MEISKELYQELLEMDYFNQCGKSVDGLYGFDVYVEKDLIKQLNQFQKHVGVILL